MKRSDANLHLSKIINQYLLDNPDFRFGQALRNAGVIMEEAGVFAPCWANHFNEEPLGMLQRVVRTLNGQQTSMNLKTLLIFAERDIALTNP